MSLHRLQMGLRSASQRLWRHQMPPASLPSLHATRRLHRHLHLQLLYPLLERPLLAPVLGQCQWVLQFVRTRKTTLPMPGSTLSQSLNLSLRTKRLRLSYFHRLRQRRARLAAPAAAAGASACCG